MAVVRIEQFKEVYEQGETTATGTFDGKEVSFFFSKVKVGYGYRHYFICPVCGEYCTKLYYNNMFCCRRCSGIKAYRGIQNTTRGGCEFITYKMNRLAAKHGIVIKYPFNYAEYDRPPRKRREPWEKTMVILQALESMRNQSIFFGKVWDTAIIKSVENGTNEYLRFPAFFHLKYFYPFDGKEIDRGKLNEVIRG